MDPIKVDFSGKDSGKKAIVIPPERAGLKIVINLIGTLVAALVGYYFMLPAFNIKAIEMYIYFGLILAAYCVMAFITSGAVKSPEYSPYARRRSTVPIAIALVVLVFLGIGYAVSSVFFRAKSYSEIIDVETANFAEDISEADFSSVPLLDNTAASTLATRALSDLADEGLVSQFTVYPTYTQINLQNRPVRVATLQYANIIKWFTNRSKGLPAYLVIDMTTQKVDLVKFPTDAGMIFSNADHFGHLLKRHLRFNYKTYLFGEAVFEVDENNNAFWIAPRLDKTIGLFGGTDVIGAVLVNPSTGECKDYSIEKIRTDPDLAWIDRVFSSDLLVEQYNYYGKYKGGFWNSVLGQKDVFVTTEGYNYLALNDDVYMYTGITSITSDESITGFTLINQRTKEAKFYRVSGAKENSAKDSAQGLVQQFEYQATFPLLLNISDQPTYFMALKDKSELVKMYAMINVGQYTIGATGTTLKECLENYIEVLAQNGIKSDIDPDDVISGENVPSDTPMPDVVTKTVAGTLEDIRTAVIDGDSYYYFKLTGSDVYYSVKAADAPEIIVANVGGKITVEFSNESGKIIETSKVTLG